MVQGVAASEDGADDATFDSLQMMRDLRPKLEKSLANFYDKYKHRSVDDDHTLLAIQLQVTMFQYEVTREFELLLAHGAQGFAMAVAAKGLIHRLVEFDKHLREVTVQEMLRYAQVHGLANFESQVRALQKEERPNLAVIRNWERLRNKATGHYDSHLDVVVELLETVDFDEVRNAAQGFLIFMLKFLILVREAVREAKRNEMK
ncbi:hypothetical protein ACVK00_003161 [Burkholderia sp. PvR073]|uniref:hypothetical protein n=1 Tax=Burkholderia ambifaria TaxID=152480 RepID=UPI003393E472